MEAVSRRRIQVGAQPESLLRDDAAERPPAGQGDPGGEPSAAHGGAGVIVEDVVKTFGPIRALRGVSLSVAPGEFVTISGPSGSGKSTLLSLIGTLDRPDAGRIAVDGVPVPEPRDAIDFRRRVVGFVFQDNLLMPYLSAKSNIETALLPTGNGRHRRAERARELLAEVGLAERAGHLPAELSGGERQRVAIARALANRPRLLLADEPTGALDSADSARILELLRAMRERHGMTLIIVSHDRVVTERSDRGMLLVDGLIRSE
jgi:ABC-type lipoprotein export system ATPase subunit